MKYGLSLPPAYLAGKETPLWTAALGPAPAALGLLKSNGIDSIELRTLGHASDAATAITALECLRQHEMGVTVHGSLVPGQPDLGLPPAEIMEALTRSFDPPVLFTVHCLSSRELSETELICQTVDSVTEWFRHADANEWPLTLALELNRAKDITDPGDHYEGLLKIKKLLPDARIGFCWDLGHTANNILQARLDNQAPAEFLHHTIHTHIHGLSPTGQTHWPLSRKSPHVQGWIQALLKSGYKGILNLELDPSRFQGVIDIRSSILESIQNLIAITNDVSRKTE